MTDIWFYEPKMLPDGKLVLEKILLVIGNDHIAKFKFNLTKMGLENIESFEKLKSFMSEKNYDYKED